ncbi:hypothetical protein [Tenacibaculum maritimum]|uniref:hypothetical protein n=1 Tax=Tenacibaculum maritimum TaxID=107401 RepID=UPI0012E52002|nr:hypothetical protein [Tenacibaculum maritimum]CAA0254853.1 hypothetical protein TMP445_80044 [Tenacibaculum maritimum]
MKTKRKVVKNIPLKLPINSTILHAFLLHYFNAPQWLWTAWIIFASIYWIAAISIISKEEKITIEN